MSINQQYLEIIFKEVIEELGDSFNWQWDERRQALLTEFSRDKKELCLPKIQQLFSDEWNKKTIKKAPKALKNQLGILTKLTNNQLLLTCPSIEKQPALMAIWWPWGHGGTYSLRLTILTNSYDISQEKSHSWWASFKEKFSTDFL